MFGQLFSTCGRSLPVFRLGLGHIKPSISVPAFRLSTSLLSKVYCHRQFYSSLSVNFQVCHPSCRTVGQRVFRRAYTGGSRSQRSAASYITAIFVFMIGAAYAGVPLYRLICQVRLSIICDCVMCILCFVCIHT